MRKAALLLAVLLAASLSTSADAKKRRAAAKPDPAIAANKNTADFIRDATLPYWASTRDAAKHKVAKRSHKKHMKRGKKRRG